MKMMFKRRYFLLLAALFFCFGALLFFFVHEGRLLLPEEEPAARYNIQVIFKALGVCFIAQLATDACNDAGESAIASKIEMASTAR